MSLEQVDVNVDAVTTDGNRAPRLPRWTRQEILVLIQGKKVAENRVRRGRSIGSSNQVVEPKWALVSSYCKRHGVNRGPVQCRKRWSNLAGDFKKIKEWELHNKSGESESFWVMRNDLRRERKLPGFFDKEVYDILDGAPAETAVVEKLKEIDEELSDYDPQEEEGGRGDGVDKETVAIGSPRAAVASPLPISEKVYEPSCQEYPKSTGNEKEVASNAEKVSPSREERKRKRSPSEDPDTHLGEQLVNVLEKNGMILTRQLESQNINCELDRDQRKDQGNSLVTVLNKLADALGRIADKL
ncbi:hypothetical protein ACHQM5_010359 [Ranunculus cassubicifolius]